MSYLGVVLNDAPLVLLKGDEASGTTAKDSGSLGDDGTYHGTPGGNYLLAYGDGPGNPAQQDEALDGSGGYVTIPDVAGLHLSGAFSAEIWLKNYGPSNTLNSYANVFQKEHTNSGAPFDDWGIGVNGQNNGITIQIGCANNSRYLLDGIPYALDSSWHHVAFTWDGTTLRCYVDGVDRTSSAATNTAGSGALAQSSRQINIGRFNSGNANSNYWHGRWCMAAVYGAALSAAQVASHYAAMFSNTQPTAGYDDTILGESSLVGYWKLDETSGTVAADSKGSNPGSYNGGFTQNNGDGPGSPTVLRDALFNGSTGYVTVPYAAALAPVHPSFEVWFKQTSVSSGTYDRVFHKNYSSNGTPYNDWTVCVGANGGTDLLVAVNTAGGNAYENGIKGAADTNWHHLVATWDGTTLRVYLDSKRVSGSAQSLGSGNAQNSSLNIEIARYNSGGANTQYFNGRCTRAALYNAPLSFAQVIAHYAAMSYDNTILSDGPISYWKLNEGAGTSVADSGAAANTGTLHGTYTLAQSDPATYPTDGNGILFDGSTGYVDMPDSAAYHLATGDMSMEAVFKSSSATQQALLSYYSGSNNGFMLLVDSSGQYWAWFGNGWTQLGTTAHDGAYHHFVATRHGGYVALYLDGVLLGEGGSVGNESGAVSMALARQNAAWGSGLYLNGTLKKVAIYGSALSPLQVKNHYGALLPASTLAERVTQLGLELAALPVPSAQVTQMGEEIVLIDSTRKAQVTQLGEEIVALPNRNVQVTMIGVEYVVKVVTQTPRAQVASGG